MFLFCGIISAQQTLKPQPFNKWEVGINGGVSNYTGEYHINALKSYQYYDWDSKAGLGFGVSVKKNFNHVFALELDWTQNNLISSTGYNGTTQYYTEPNYKTLVNEYDLNSVWNINNLLSTNKFDRIVYVYGKVGVGLTHLNNKVGSITGMKTQFPTIPLGAGVAVKLTQNIRANIGTQWSWVNSDRLEGLKSVDNVQHVIYGTKLYTYVGITVSLPYKKKSVQIVELPVAKLAVQPKPEPKPEPAPIVAPITKSTVIGNKYKVYFEFDKWNLTKKSEISLDSLVSNLKQDLAVTVNIKSHTDSRGSDGYNMKLSEKRGKSVITYLVAKEIKSNRIDAQAFGETQLVNKCKDGVKCTKVEHALNRRTETVIIQ